MNTSMNIMAGRRCRARHASRGQALIMAVLVMFLLAGLAGLFIAMLNQAIVQTASAVDRAKLEQVALAGLNYVKNELLYSIDGADWRPDNGPDAANVGWVNHGPGFYKVRLTYGPTSPLSTLSTPENTSLESTPRPFGDNPLDRYLRVEVEARYALDNSPQMEDPRNPDFATYMLGFKSKKRMLTRRITAYMPIGLTDYLRWITNSSGDPEPVVLGSDLQMNNLATLDVDPMSPNPDYANASAIILRSVPYLEEYEGPIRSEVDTKFGQVRVDLTKSDTDYISNFSLRRDDMVEIAGQLTGQEGASATARSILVNGKTVTMANGVDPVSIAAAANAIGYLQTQENNPVIRKMRAPLLNAPNPVTGTDRYRALTRESAFWEFMSSNTAGTAVGATAYNTRMLGWGDGLYIDNHEDLQYGGDLAKLREEWLNPPDASATNDGITCWDSDYKNKKYDPVKFGKAVEIILGDWTYDASGRVVPPLLTLKWKSGKTFYDKDGQQITANTIKLPYPRNGVIFAEGNVVVHGNLPASTAYARNSTGDIISLYNHATPRVQRPGGWNAAGGNIQYYVTDINRRFDLTIVSGGTVYIGDSILGPASRKKTYKVAGGDRLITRGDPYDSKLGLLAMDYVTLNPTTRMETPPEPPEAMPNTEAYWRANNSKRIQYNFGITGDPADADIQLLLKHAGEAVVGGADYSMMRMWVNDQLYWWTPTVASGTNLVFYPTLLTNSLFPGTFPDQWGGPLYNDEPFNVQTWALNMPSRYTMPVGDPRVTPLVGNGERNVLTFEWTQGNDYLQSADSGVTVTGVDIQVDALMYAQRGSWFIIPGKYYVEQGETPFPLPGPQEDWPLDIGIVINGAIAENRPAPPEAVYDWQQHWRGSNLFYWAADEDSLPYRWDPATSDYNLQTGNFNNWDPVKWRWSPRRRMGIVYQYDATLALPVCYDLDTEDATIRYYSPRLPKLPVSPNVFSVSTMKGI